MHVLYPETIAAAQDCTCIMRLVYVLEDDGHMPCPLLQNFGEPGSAVFGDKGCNVLQQFQFKIVIEIFYICIHCSDRLI